MDIINAIVNPTKAFYNMIRSLFRWNELHNEKMMKLELERAELVNDGTAIQLSILVCNHGLTELTIKSIKPKLTIANSLYHCNSIDCYKKIAPEDHNGQLVELIVPAPFLKTAFSINKYNQALKCDLFQADADIDSSIYSMSIHIKRGFFEKVRHMQLDRWDKWKFKLTGLHHFVRS